MEDNMMEVAFDIICKLCKFKDVPETNDPCNECLDTGWRESTRKPIMFDAD